MKGLSPISDRLNSRIVIIFAVSIVWAGTLVVGVVPAVRKVSAYSKEIETASNRIESLNAMSAAGGWFEAVSKRLGPPVLQEYGRLFPLEKRREELFLEIVE